MLSLVFATGEKKNLFNSKSGAGFKWMTAMLKPHKTCWPDTRYDAFMCLNIDVSAEMGVADLKTDAARSRFFSQQCYFFFIDATTTYTIRFIYLFFLVICHLVSAPKQNIFLRLDIIPHTGGYGAGMMQRRCQLSWRLWFYVSFSFLFYHNIWR